MFNVGGGEVLVILVLALVVLGPDKLPEAARAVGKHLATFRRISGGFRAEINDAMNLAGSPAPASEPVVAEAPAPSSAPAPAPAPPSVPAPVATPQPEPVPAPAARSSATPVHESTWADGPVESFV